MTMLAGLASEISDQAAGNCVFAADDFGHGLFYQNNLIGTEASPVQVQPLRLLAQPTFLFRPIGEARPTSPTRRGVRERVDPHRLE
jgi:hypothetical protein